MTNHKKRSVIILGLALFAMFFGAGNLLLPVFLGTQSREEVWSTFSGFISSGLIAPVLGIIAVMLSGNYFTDLGKRAHAKLAYILATINVLCIGPLIALPRLGASVFEVSVKPIVPDAQPVWVCFFFFGVVMMLSFSYKNIVTVLGKYLSPVLLIALLLFIGCGLFSDLDFSVNSTVEYPFFFGFTEGYQTLDVLAAVIFAVVLINGAKVRGYTQEKEKNNIVLQSTLLAASIMLIVYAGLFYIGSGTPIQDSSLSRSHLLIAISKQIFGSSGIFFLSFLMIITCLTTAIALTAAVANYFDRITKGKLGYIEAVITTTLISLILAINGVDDIIQYAGALLNFIYPITLVLILTVVLFGKQIVSKTPYLTALIVTAIISFLRVFSHNYPNDKNLQAAIEVLPLSGIELEWVIPAFLSFFVVVLIEKLSVKPHISH